jgi:5-methylcytosine-specific restriction endonuclease McrA
MSEVGADVLLEVCAALTNRQIGNAGGILRDRYPFEPPSNSKRQSRPALDVPIFIRDGFLDRYSGERLVFPGTLRLLAKLLPDEFPYHPNWKTSACHLAFWELSPTIDHIVPFSRGGADTESNWVTTSMLRNLAKANFTLDQLGWSLRPPGDLREWDGLMSWFLIQVEENPTILDDNLRKWQRAAQAGVKGRTAPGSGTIE